MVTYTIGRGLVACGRPVLGVVGGESWAEELG